MTVTVKQLPASAPTDAHVLLLCNNCLNEYSATRGDYFMLDPNEPMLCGECNHELELVEKYTSYRSWKAPAAPSGGVR